MKRQPELDALRGLMLVLMTVTHLPVMTAIDWRSQQFGYVSSAEGFVFLSAYLVGRIYSSAASNGGWGAVVAPLWRRALKLYGYHLVTLAFAFTVGAGIALQWHRPGLEHLLGFYLQQPHQALLDSLILVYCPPLMDVLPLYVLFLLLTPLVLMNAQHKGWGRVFAVSAIVWALAQWGLRRFLYDAAGALDRTALPPFNTLGAFDPFALQLLWIGGLWLGQRHLRDPQFIRRMSPALTLGALGVAAGLLVLRCVISGNPAGPEWLLQLLDKWHLGPLRLLNFAALTLAVLRYGQPLRKLPSGALQRLGRASLPVFTAHVLLCLLVFAVIPEDGANLSPLAQALLAILTFAALLAVATAHQNIWRLTRLTPQRIGNSPG